MLRYLQLPLLIKFCFGFWLFATTASAQLYPVQVTPQLVPPYSVYLSDYATPGSEKLRVIILQRDLSEPAYQLRLVMIVSLNGKVIMRTSRAFNPLPIQVNPGIPTVVSGADLAPYVDSRNIDFVGYSREQYERTRALPEGAYQITFLAYDYRRPDVQVSNEGVSFYYLTKSEPPLINYPPCGTKIPMLMPQQIVFSWLPRNTSSPNSAAETEYEFSLYEVRPAGRNQNDVVMTTPPVFRTRLDFTQLVYGPAEPLLLEGMQYVWRVQAIDKNGKDAFRNNGFSEVCTFTYGGIEAMYDIGRVKNLQAEGETERRGRIFWEAGDYDEYNVFYKKTGTGYEWFNSKVKSEELKLFDLEPDTEYETRVQVKKGNVWGAYSDIVVFRTLPMRAAQCGDQLPTFNTTPGPPLPYATSGMIINTRGMEMQLLEVQHLGENGWYKGIGRISVPYLGGAAFTAKFDRIYIDDNRNVVLGRVDFVTKGVAAMIEEQLADQRERQEEKVQQENRDEWVGADFYEKIFLFDNLVIDDVRAGTDSYIDITDSRGNTIANAEVMQVLNTYPEKAIIIEDKNGDQWVVEKDKATGQTKVSKVSGGGLSPGMGEISEDAVSLLKKALTELRKMYSDSKMKNLKGSYESSIQALLTYKESVKEELVIGANSMSVSKENEIVFLEPEPIVASQDEFSVISTSFKEAESSYNLAKVSLLFARETNTIEDYKIIINNIKINGQTYEEYVSKRRIEGANDDILKIEIKDALLVNIREILEKNNQ